MPDQDPPAEWPEFGVVEFQNYQTRLKTFSLNSYLEKQKRMLVSRRLEITVEVALCDN
jgi:hypothetical protein